MKQTALLLPTLAITLTACTTPTPGTPQAGDSGPAPTSTASAPSTEVSLALQPCDLLSPQDLTTLNLPEEAEEKEIGPARTCQWQTSGSHTVSVGILDQLGIADVRSEQPPQPTTVGTRRAVRYVGVGGTCGVAIELTGTSRVDVVGITSGGDDLARSCEIANQVVALVEPKLP